MADTCPSLAPQAIVFDGIPRVGGGPKARHLVVSHNGARSSGDRNADLLVALNEIVNELSKPLVITVHTFTLPQQAPIAVNTFPCICLKQNERLGSRHSKHTCAVDPLFLRLHGERGCR